MIESYKYFNNLNKRIDYICQDCDKQFSSLQNYKKHLDWHKLRKKFNCKICDKNFNFIMELKVHNKTAHKKIGPVKKVYCTKCPKMYSTHTKLEHHFNLAHSENSLVIKEDRYCKICLKQFETVISYKQHTKFHFDGICYFCNHGFGTDEAMMNHVKEKHHPHRLFPCVYCNKKKCTKKMLVRHIRSVHKISNSMFFCGICNNSKVGYLSPDYLKLHITKYHYQVSVEEKVLDPQKNELELYFPLPFCPEDDQQFSNHDIMNVEFLEPAEEFLLNDEESFLNDLICRICGLNFLNENDYILHHVAGHNDFSGDEQEPTDNTAIEFSSEIKEGMVRFKKDVKKTFQQIPSDIIFEENDNPNIEIQLDSNQIIEQKNSENNSIYSYECPKCPDEKFQSQLNLNIHLSHTHDMKCLICNQCGAAFNRTIDLKIHRTNHHKENTGVIVDLEFEELEENGEKSFKCLLCLKKYQRKLNLEKHKCEFYKNYNLSIPCTYCSDTFTSAQKMYIHRKIHISNSLYCSLCDKKFMTEAGLKYHLKTHNNIQDYKCPYCEKKFTASTNLSAHIKARHTKDKPFSCMICDRQFSTKGHLQKHGLSHEEKKCLCTVCGKAFYQNSHLTQHMWSHKEFKQFQCEYCNSGFTTRAYLNRHLFRVHSKKDF